MRGKYAFLRGKYAFKMLGYIKTIVVVHFNAYAVLKFKRNYHFLSIDYFKSAHYIR